MVPAHDILVSTHLLHLIHELLLEYRVDRLDRHRGSLLRHREDIDHGDCVVIYDLTHHEAHNFKRHTSTAVLHHFQKRE